jgi:hypothetical protein
LLYQFDSKEAAKESILYSYKHGFSGFAAALTESQAELIAGATMLVNCKFCIRIRLVLCLQVIVVGILLSRTTMQISQELFV